MKRHYYRIILIVFCMLVVPTLISVQGAFAAQPQVAAGVYHTVGLKADGTVVAVGDNALNCCRYVSSWSDIVQVAAGREYTVGLKSDGTVVAVGRNTDGQCNVSDWTNITQVAAGGIHTVGLKSDGTVVAVGYNGQRQCNVSDWSDITQVVAGGIQTVGLKSDGSVVVTRLGDEVSDWSDITQVAAGYSHTVGLKSDGTVVAAGSYSDGRCDVGSWSDIVQVDAGGEYTVGVKADGTVVVAGVIYNYSQYNVSEWTDITQIAAGYAHTVGLKPDGTVVAVGYNTYSQCNVDSWTDIIQLAARNHTVGLKADGTVVAVGVNGDGQCNVDSWTDIIQVAVGDSHTVGLKSDGTAVAVGDNDFGRCNVGSWSDIVQVAAGRYYTLGLRSDGTVVRVGANYTGELNVGSWTDITQVAAGHLHTVGLKSDGTVVAVGASTDGRCDVGSWSDIVQVAAGYWHTVGLKSDGTVVAVGNNDYDQCNVGSWSDIVHVAAGSSYTVGLKSDGAIVAVGQSSYGACNFFDWYLGQSEPFPILWSDNFDGGPHQTWKIYNTGDNSTHDFINDRYELHAEDSSAELFLKHLIGYVDYEATDSIIQARVQQIILGDNYIAAVGLRGNETMESCYTLYIDSASTIGITKSINGFPTNLTTQSCAGVVDYTDCYLKFAAIGDTLYGKAWNYGDPEPENWMIEVIDGEFSSGVGGVAVSTFPYTGPKVVQVAFDDVTFSGLAVDDSDGDGYPDNEDAFPDDPTEWQDSDADGIGDNGDAFPYDPNEWEDSDFDGVGNNSDDFPYDPTEWQDSDADGIGDNSDDFPYDPAASVDTDNDGMPDEWNPGKTSEDSTSVPKLVLDEDDDNDWMPDEWENANGLDTLTDDSNEDNDNDGLTNYDEYMNQTDPNIENIAYPEVLPPITGRSRAYLEWDFAYQIEGIIFKIMMKKDGEATFVDYCDEEGRTVILTENWAIVDNLDDGEKYFFKVVAGYNGVGRYSEVVSATIDDNYEVTLSFENPVLLIPGTGGEADAWHRMKWHLEDFGLVFGGELLDDYSWKSIEYGGDLYHKGDFYTCNYPNPCGAIDANYQPTKNFIDAIRQAWGNHPKVTLVGQSLGGLRARAYLQKKDRDMGDSIVTNKVNRLITIGTPHLGVLPDHEEYEDIDGDGVKDISGVWKIILGDVDEEESAANIYDWIMLGHIEGGYSNDPERIDIKTDKMKVFGVMEYLRFLNGWDFKGETLMADVIDGSDFLDNLNYFVYDDAENERFTRMPVIDYRYLVGICPRGNFGPELFGITAEWMNGIMFGNPKSGDGFISEESQNFGPYHPINDAISVNTFYRYGQHHLSELHDYMGLLHALDNQLLTITAKCPVDLEVVSPSGKTQSKTHAGILGAKYTEADVNGDGEIDSFIEIPMPEEGVYQIIVTPQVDADPGDTYSLEVAQGDEITVIKEDAPVSELNGTPEEYVIDESPPNVAVVVPGNNVALQDIVTVSIDASDDISDVETVLLSIKEAGGANGISVGYDDIPATYNPITDRWEYQFDTTQLSDGYYLVFAKAVDSYGNEGISDIVPFSIRNWAVLECLPSTEDNKAGRTMPVKFALRIVPSVDPEMPFVHNENLEIIVYEATDPDTVLQASLFGDTSTDYRIDDTGEIYITNFKTDKKPADYIVEIWRPSNNFLIGDFGFRTVK